MEAAFPKQRRPRYADVDTVEIFRDMVSTRLDVSLSSISVRMNNEIKVLTIIATIFIPIKLIEGIYGIKFMFMP
jgi:magnesium transporter